ncbi:hypothetical protein LSCM1_00142 [Leishmania martiniquensis]|uniref:Cilia- and flagella-associated protein 36 n=1 Tax=Leishmania martiniquensis TaxID=1580590 RepID=A0A836FY85_9TRYP|nr:hypothetical protein LSCM1_00142 [Leishmania martiniquensis]
MADNQWITEALVQFSESPIWRTPVENFVDDNCCIFRNESEMQLEYTVVHNKFKELVDSLLTCFILELGVPMETAVEALQSSLAQSDQSPGGRSERQAAKKLLKRILNSENFLSFYTMMVKRNLELDILANAELSEHCASADGGAPLRGELGGNENQALASAHRIIDFNGNIDDEEALRRAIEQSLQDIAAQQQVRAYSEACMQEEADMRVAAIELQANREKAQLEAALSSMDIQDPAGVERYRQEHMDAIDTQRATEIQQLYSHTMSGSAQKADGEASQLTADFSSPETPQALPARTPVPAALPAPVTAASKAPALPLIRHGQDALPAIPCKTAVTAAQSASRSPEHHNHHTTTSVKPALTPGPMKEELEKRAEYMREQREKILARNRAARTEQLSTFLQNNGSETVTSSSEAEASSAAAHALTVEIARRLRGDLIGEGRKKGI